MCMGIPIKEGKEFLKHDGMEKLWPTLEVPYCYRGFNFAECIMFAYVRGFSAIYHEFDGAYSPYMNIPAKPMKLPSEYKRHILTKCIGVFTLEVGSVYHAVAFSDQVVYDPRGTQFILPNNQFKNVQACITIEPRDTKWCQGDKHG